MLQKRNNRPQFASKCEAAQTSLDRLLEKTNKKHWHIPVKSWFHGERLIKRKIFEREDLSVSQPSRDLGKGDVPCWNYGDARSLHSKQFKARTIISMTLVKIFYGEDMIVPPYPDKQRDHSTWAKNEICSIWFWNRGASREGNENFVISSDDVILCSGVFHRGLGMLIENIERKVFSVWFHIPCR